MKSSKPKRPWFHAVAARHGAFYKGSGVVPGTARPAPVGARPVASMSARRNDACPCGSGRKFKLCCMRGT